MTETISTFKETLALFMFMGLAICFTFPAFLIGDSSPKAAYYGLVILPGLMLVALDWGVFVDNIKVNRGIQLVGLLIAYWCLTLLWGQDPSIAGSQLKRALVVMLYVLVIWHVLSCYQQYADRFIIVLFTLFCVGVIWSSNALPALDLLLGRYRLGTGTSFGQAIHAAHYYGTFFSLSLGFLLFGNSKAIKMLSSVVLVLSLAAIILTKSRGGYLAVISTVFIAASLYVFIYKKWKLAAVICAVFVLLALGLYEYFPKFILARGDSYRFEIWVEARRLIQDNFWFGIGLGARPPITASGFAHAHNLYLNIWLATGLVGLLLFAAMLTTVLKAVFRSDNKLSVIYTLPLVFFLVAMMTDSQHLINSPNEAWFCFWYVLMVLNIEPPVRKIG